jgi:glycine/D-amino acid oxidase-like deaminating enzyme
MEGAYRFRKRLVASMTNKKDILVLGAGVSGLSTGILLLKAGYDVHIWAKDLPPNTTSNIAAAFWYPYLCNPRDKATNGVVLQCVTSRRTL